MNSKAIITVAALAAGIIIAVTACSDGAKGGSTSQTKATAPFLIEPKVCVGNVRAGMGIEDVIAQVGKPDQKSNQLLEYQRFGFAVGLGDDGIVTKVFCGSFPGIQDPLKKPFTGRTKEGIGIGSRRADVIKGFGEPSRASRAAGKNEERLSYSSQGLLFILQEGKVSQITVELGAGK